MSSISFPSYVAAIARRIFNVVSTLSIYNQYYSLQDGKSNLRQRLTHRPLTEPFGETRLDPPGWAVGGKGTSLGLLRERLKSSPSSGVLKASTVSIPFLNRNWWQSFTSAAEQQGESSVPPSSPVEPPPDLNRRRSPQSTPPPRKLPEYKPPPESPPDTIHQLLMNPALVDPVRTPRYPIVLNHGLYGFDARGPTNFPSLRMHYWANALAFLRGTVKAEVIVTSVPGTGSIQSRSSRLDEQLQDKARGRGVNFLAHSMGGLDCRHLITHIRPTEYTPLSLTTISTPHRGSPFMDWCVDNIGIGKLQQQERQLLYGQSRGNVLDDYESPQTVPPPILETSNDGSSSSSSLTSLFNVNVTSLPSSFTTLLLSTVDSPAYACLTSAYLNEIFNPTTPNDPNVKYFSVAGRTGSVSILHPFWFTKMVLDGYEEKERARLLSEAFAQKDSSRPPPENPVWADQREWGNDGLVTVQSARWGEYLGTLDNVDHWEMRGARGIEFGVDLPAIPALGLGSAPAGTSTGHVSAPSPNSNREAWYIREWTRFLGGWKRDEKGGVSVSTNSQSSPKESAPEETDEERDEAKRQRQREFTKGDQVVRASTDKLSLVFDWIVDQVPNPQMLTGAGTLPVPPNLFKGKDKEADVSSTSDSKDRDDDTRKLAAEMIAHTVAAGRSSSSSSKQSDHDDISPLRFSSDTKPENLVGEAKKMMERERQRWKKNELATKADLERFYVALTRKMWDEGL